MKSRKFMLLVLYALVLTKVYATTGNFLPSPNLQQGLSQSITSTVTTLIPGQTSTVTSTISLSSTQPATGITAQVTIEGGLSLISCSFKDITANQNYTGVVDTFNNVITIAFTGLPNIIQGQQYKLILLVKGAVADITGIPIANNALGKITTIVNGVVEGSTAQSSVYKQLTVRSYDTQNLLFDYTENTGIELDSTDSWSVAVIDYNNDKKDDLFFTDKRATKPNRLYKNIGNNKFVRIISGPLVTDLAQSVTSAWADYDNDGDLDVIVVNNTQKPNYFYVNNGCGGFTKNASIGFAQQVGYYHHASWVDVDNDGQLELFLGNYWPTRFNELWHKTIDGTWELWQDNLLSQTQGSGVGATWFDFDNDNYQDLIIPNNDGNPNKMFRNTGNGNFIAVSNVVTQHGGHSTATTWGDIDNDGYADLFISNAGNNNNELYKNNGASHFTLVTNAQIVTDAGHSHGCAFADVDKDMDLDLFVANDQGVKFLYINDGLGNFTRKTDEWPAANFGMSYVGQFADIDADGDQDLVTATHGNQRNYIFTSNNNTKRYMLIRLVGSNSNKSAIGAKIKVKAGGKWQSRTIVSQNGFCGQSSLRQHFGMAAYAYADSVEIRWPSGYVQKMRRVATNQSLVFFEPNTSTITATAYYDANSNCQKNIGEFLLPNLHFKVMPGNYHAYSNNNGILSVNLPNGNYQLTLVDNNFSMACNSSMNIQVGQCGGSSNLGNIAMRSACVSANLNVTASAPAIRRGFPSYYLVNISNKGVGNAQNISITAKLPVALSVDSASLQWVSRVTNAGICTFTWNLQALPSGRDTIIKLFYTAGLSLMPDDIISSTFNATAGADCNNTDNSFTDYQRIYGSIDPNDILAFPIGETENHFIANTQELTYRIRFQNVGNCAAEFVTLVDSLPEGLDVESLHNVTSSHQVQISIERGVAYFYFPDIQLPDSTTDAEGSNGFVQFTIAQTEGNPVGTTIINKAYIRFDYNEDIITNTVFHNILTYGANNQGTGLFIFPNPSLGESYILTENTGNGTPDELINLKVFNLAGNQQYSQNCTGSVPLLNIGHLPNGVYVVKATGLNGKEFQGKIVLQH